MLRPQLLSLLLTLFLLSTPAFVITAVAQDFVPSTVVVKFKSGSDIAVMWMKQNRSGEIPEFVSLLGSHKSSGYLLDATLVGLATAHAKQSKFLFREPISPLALICVITYNSQIDPVVAARKLASNLNVEYAEPMAVERIFATPNDSLIADQYHLPLIKAFDAWELLPPTGEIVVGIVDTGIDTTHPDIGANVWRNVGEMGLDLNKLDKRFNGIDDDGNGFTDDWFGWDFAGADGLTPDNTPLPGHVHGTHIGGIIAAISNNKIGVSGVGQRIKLMPVKVSVNSSGSTSVLRTADAILYAASNNAKVINCSFGSPSQSFANADVIREATQLGALIVGASGNETLDQAFYPASYPEVISVTATNWSDVLASFANIHSTVDVSAPGVAILSTVPNSQYAMFDGTSMAAPVVTAIAAMFRFVYLDATPMETIAFVKANVDNIDSVNAYVIGRIGTGRVNALKVLAKTKSKYAELTSVVPTDQDGNGIISPGETLTFEIVINNILDSCPNVSIEVKGAQFHFTPIILQSVVQIGPMRHGESQTISKVFVRIPDTVSFNAELGLLFSIKDSTIEIGRQLAVFTVNPSYITMQENDIHVTVNSRGNIGYNDFPSNIQGIGLGYKSDQSLLFEGGLMVAKDLNRVPNVVRGVNTSIADTSFTTRVVVVERKDSAFTGSVVTCSYADLFEVDKIGVEIIQKVYQPTADSVRNIIILTFDIFNTSDTSLSNIYAAYFTDWDVGPMGDGNGCAWDHTLGNGLVQNVRNSSYPTVAMSMISPLTINFYALDNGGSLESPSIYDQFLRSEKWQTMTGGIARPNSLINDVSMVIGAGPFTIQPKSSQQVCFIIGVGNVYSTSADGIQAGRNLAIGMGLNVATYVPSPLQDRIIHLEGGPTLSAGPTEITFQIRSSTNVVFDIVDLFGRTVKILGPNKEYQSGTFTETIDIPNTAGAAYFLRMLTASTTAILPIAIYR
ncbi:MAG: S8 family serine peptidase [Ignavibacteria bacterium]|nr:S8 family serine peptidase [Ignavibacteria bacterium]